MLILILVLVWYIYYNTFSPKRHMSISYNCGLLRQDSKNKVITVLQSKICCLGSKLILLKENTHEYIQNLHQAYEIEIHFKIMILFPVQSQ